MVVLHGTLGSVPFMVLAYGCRGLRCLVFIYTGPMVSVISKINGTTSRLTMYAVFLMEFYHFLYSQFFP